jgi:cytochrome oxidase Cu insertion factor (SCO1/SenC/PrrC family)
MRRRRAIGAVFALMAGLAGLPPARAQLPSSAPRQDFVAPAPGSYALPPIQPAADGWVLEGNRLPRRLSSYTHGALTLLSFVYTYCADPIGCPLAYATFDTIKRRALADPALRGQVRLVSLSFDPVNDTPEAMRAYGAEHARSTELRWHFLTTYSTRFLKPILDGFGQDVEIELDANGAPTRARAHMLKVFLLDQKGQVREIYSAAFLHPEVILNDLRTLALESTRKSQAKARPLPG